MVKWSWSLVGVAAAVTPTQKVITMLEDMLAKGKKEMQDEAVQFSAYKQWCEDEITKKSRDIEEGQDTIEKLSADQEKFTTDADMLSKQVVEHNAEITKLTAELEDATALRKEERTEYNLQHKDYSESIDAIKRAVQVLKAQNYDRKQPSKKEAEAVLLQQLDPSSSGKVMSFLSTADVDDVYNPSADIYEFKSGGVIDMLEKLETKFMEEKRELENKESSGQHAFNMYRQDTEAQIANLKNSVSDKSALAGKKRQAAASAATDLADAKATLKDDTKYLADTKATCTAKANDFESRSKLRKEEIDVLGQAVEILGGAAVKGAAEKYLPGGPAADGTSFLALKSKIRMAGAEEQDKRREAVLDYLQIQARKIGSGVLAQLSVHAGADPFEKVKNIIQDLITRLLEEAKEEARHHGWCTTELARNKKIREEKGGNVEDLTSEIDGLNASISKLEEELTDLAAAIAEIDKNLAEQHDLRVQEKEANETKIREAGEAQKAVAQAVVLLKDFYAKAGTATALIQQKKQPAIFEGAYTGMGTANGGVVAMLEVIESDFARLEAETEAAENSAAREYNQFKEDSMVSKAQKTTDVQHKDQKKQDQQKALVEKKEDLRLNEEALEAANKYFDKLKPQCINTGVSHEERTQKREEEIESLKEALKILSGEDLGGEA